MAILVGAKAARACAMRSVLVDRCGRHVRSAVRGCKIAAGAGFAPASGRHRSCRTSILSLACGARAMKSYDCWIRQVTKAGPTGGIPREFLPGRDERDSSQPGRPLTVGNAWARVVPVHDQFAASASSGTERIPITPTRSPGNSSSTDRCLGSRLRDGGTAGRLPVSGQQTRPPGAGQGQNLKLTLAPHSRGRP